MRRLIAVILAVTCVAPFARAQGASDLRALGRQAGTIFAGTVVNIEAASGDIGQVRVTFRVTHAFRGASAGETLTISEWDGLWMAGERYRVGETLLLFLYPPSDGLGFTTTVGGARGRIPLSRLSLALPELRRMLAEEPAAPDERPQPKPVRRPPPAPNAPVVE